MTASLLECVGGPLDGEIVSIEDVKPEDYVLNYRVVGYTWRSCRRACKRKAMYRAMTEENVLMFLEGVE